MSKQDNWNDINQSIAELKRRVGATARPKPRLEFIDLTELWQDGKYSEVGDAIRGWNARQVAEFCAYFSKYLGTSQLELLYKFV